MKKNRVIIVIALAMFVMGGMVFAGGQKESKAGGSGQDEELRVLFVSPMVGHPVWL